MDILCPLKNDILDKDINIFKIIEKFLLFAFL